MPSVAAKARSWFCRCSRRALRLLPVVRQLGVDQLLRRLVVWVGWIAAAHPVCSGIETALIDALTTRLGAGTKCRLTEIKELPFLWCWLLTHGIEPDRPLVVRGWVHELGDQYVGRRRRQRADRRLGRRNLAGPGGRAGGDDDQRPRESGTHDPAVALDRLACSALVSARRDGRSAARRLCVQPDRRALAAGRVGGVSHQHRLAIPIGRKVKLIRDALAVVPAGIVCIRPYVGGGGCERPVGESVLPQLRADEGGDAGDAGGELASDPAREDRRLYRVRRAALAARTARAGGRCRRDHGDLVG